MKKLISLFAIILFFVTNINAQTIDPYQWKKHLDNNALTYYQKRDSAVLFFSQHDSLKEIRKYGYKDFLRWSFYWENRLDTNGFTLNLPKMLDSMLNHNASAFQNKSSINNIAPWKPIGIDKKPVAGYDGFRLGGIGMIYCLEINPLNNNIILAGTPNGGIWRTDNLGQSWRPLKFNIETNNGVYDIGLIGVMSIKIDPNDTSRIYIGTGSRELQTGYTHKYSYGLLYSNNSGTTWKRSGLSPSLLEKVNIKDIAIVGNVNANNVVIHALTDHEIHTSIDGGVTFNTYPARNNFGTDLDFYKIEVLPANSNIVIASGNGLYISYNSGVNWQNITNIFNSSINKYSTISIACNSALGYELKVATIYNSIYKLYTINVLDLNNIVVSNVSDGLQSTVKNKLLEMAIPENNISEIYFGSLYYYYSNNNGQDFAQKNSLMHDDIRDIKIVSIGSNNYIYVAHDAGIDLSIDNGITYEFIGNGIQASNFYNLTVSENDPNLIIGGVHDSGTNIKEFDNWSANIYADGFGETLIIEDDYKKEGAVVFSNANYSLRRLKYTSNTFTGASGGNGMCRFIDKTLSNNNVLVYYVDMAYTGHLNNIIYKSTNKGDTWTTHSYSGIPSHIEFGSFDISDDNQIWMIPTWDNSAQQVELYVSTNSGVNFSKVNYPGSHGITDIEIVKNGVNYDIWVTKGNFDWDGDRVWHSNDLGATWTKLGNNTLGEYPVNTIAYDKVNEMLFAGTDRGVYYFDNSNDTWYEYNTDLPKCIITKLVISYSNNKLRAATFGRGVLGNQFERMCFLYRYSRIYRGRNHYIFYGD